MGVLSMYEENIPSRSKIDTSPTCTVEVADCHGIPELRVGPLGSAYAGYIASFEDWKQFESFVEAVNSLHFRLKEIKE